jgi:hypothetical protein
MSRQEHMSRTWTKRTKIIGALAAALAAAALVPSGGVAAPTSSERTTVKSCGHLPLPVPPGSYFPIKVAVVHGNVPCRMALDVMAGWYSNNPRVKGDRGWSCVGPEGRAQCEKTKGRYQGTITARFGCDPRTKGPKSCDGRP